MSRDFIVGNTISFTRVTVTTPGTAQQLASNNIYDGFQVVVKNRATNTGNFYIAPTAAAAQSSTGNRKVLTPGESVTLHLSNTNLLYVDADNSTDVLEITVETKT